MKNIRSLSPIVRISIAAAAITLIFGVVIFGLSEGRVTGQTDNAACAPTATDGVDTSSIEVSGLDVSWAAHAQACAYRVSLIEKPDDAELDSVESTENTTYTIPATLVTDQSTYQVTVKILDSDGNVAGIDASHLFVYEEVLPLCSPVSGPTPVPTPMAVPGAATPGCGNPSTGGGTTDDQRRTDTSTPGPGSWSGVGSESYRPIGAKANASYFSHASHILKCNTAGVDCPEDIDDVTGLRALAASVSYKESTLASGKSWDDYHYVNSLRVVSATTDADGDLEEITCPNSTSADNHSDTDININYTGPEMLAIGIATGAFGSTTYENEIIIQAYYKDPNQSDKVRCKVFPTGATITDHTAIYMGISSDGTAANWRMFAVHHAFRGRTIKTGWGAATSISSGHEIWARSQDKDSVQAPFNYVDKVIVVPSSSVNAVPWYESSLPTGLQNRSEQVRHDPFVVNDAVPDDFTSISACVVEPETRICYAPKPQ